jgi:hypothetical protein
VLFPSRLRRPPAARTIGVAPRTRRVPLTAITILHCQTTPLFALRANAACFWHSRFRAPLLWLNRRFSCSNETKDRREWADVARTHQNNARTKPRRVRCGFRRSPPQRCPVRRHRRIRASETKNAINASGTPSGVPKSKRLTRFRPLFNPTIETGARWHESERKSESRNPLAMNLQVGFQKIGLFQQAATEVVDRRSH